jgi:uncharacterized damage-inducible protein DinB
MTKQLTGTAVVVALASLGILACQAPAPAPAGESAAGATNAVSAAVRDSCQSARRNVAESAELMAEADYGFQPVDTVRTFGQILTHLAGANYVFCSAAKGEEPPHAEAAFEETVTSRDETIAVLGESLAYCDGVYDAATDAWLAETVAQPFGGGDGPRAAALLGNINHLNEHYGNLVTYFRIKGMVPPSSRQR